MPLLLCILTVFFVSRTASAAALPCVVVDKRTSLPVPGATVCVDGTDRCVTVDKKGTGRISGINPDTYGIIAAAAGYDTLRIANVLVKTGENLPLSIELSRSGVITLDTMTVVAGRISPRRAEQTISVTRLSTFDLANTAGTANDINRVVASLPSVVCLGTDMDNTLYVRGGQSRENLFVVDGIEIDNISHFSNVGGSGGGMGYIDGATVSGLDFYAGGIPASYPPAISSIMDIQLRDGSFTKIMGKTEANIAGLGLSLEGPVVRDKASVLAEVRYIDLATVKGFLPLYGVPRFGDGLFRFSLKPNDRHSVIVTALGGYDRYSEDSDTEDWPFTSDYRQELFQAATALQWQYRSELFRNRLLASFRLRNQSSFEQVHDFSGPVTFSDDRYKNGKPAGTDTVIGPGDTLVSVKELYTKKELWYDGDQRRFGIVKDDAVLYFRDNDQLCAGVSAGITSYHLAHRLSRLSRWSLTWMPDPAAMPPLYDSVVYTDTPYVADKTVYDTAIGAYTQYVLSEGPFTLVSGIRADYFRLVRDYGISPRLSASIRMPAAGVFSVSGGLLYQLPAELSDHLYDLMVPNPNYALPRPPFSSISLQRNWQAALGFEREFSGSRSIDIETYFKWYDREYTRVNPDRYLYEKEFEDAAAAGRPWDLARPDGKKRVYGLEVLFQKKQQKGLYYAVGYSLFSAENRYADGKWYNDVNNLRNTLGVTLGARFLRHHALSVRLSAAEGRPYSKARFFTLPGNSSEYFDYDTAAGYYTERLSPSASVNLRYGFNFFPKWGTVTGYIEIWNLLNYQPVIERRLGISGYRNIRANGIIPLAGIAVEF
jgi:hypothetical protein